MAPDILDRKIKSVSVLVEDICKLDLAFKLRLRLTGVVVLSEILSHGDVKLPNTLLRSLDSFIIIDPCYGLKPALSRRFYLTLEAMTLQDDAMDSKGSLAGNDAERSSPPSLFLCNGGRIDARMISRNMMQSLTVALHKVGIITPAASPRT